MESIIKLQFSNPVPSLNTVYRTNRYNNVYKSKKTKEFEQFIKDTFIKDTLLDTPIYLVIDFYILKDCDIDAKLKVLLDSLQGVIYENDIQIQKLTVTKHKVSKRDEILTTVEIFPL